MIFEQYPESIEIVKDKLYWISARQAPLLQGNRIIINYDDKLIERPMFSDFGPIDISKVTKFVQELNYHLENPRNKDKAIYHHTSTNDLKRTNAALMMAAYQVIMLKKTPEQAWEPFSELRPPLQTFSDSTSPASKLHVTILDCLHGLKNAMKLGWYNIETFDRQQYETLARNEKGNMTWIIPKKILAFSCAKKRKSGEEDSFLNSYGLDEHESVFTESNIHTVVRLNETFCERETSKYNNITHSNLFFDEMEEPTDQIIEKFFTICNMECGAVGVYSEVGFGRTSLMIACYMMRKYKFTAAAAVAWIRLCRPGSIFANQHDFLIKNEEKLMKVHKKLSLITKKSTTCGDEGTCEEVNGVVATPPKVTPVKGNCFKGWDISAETDNRTLV